MANLKPPYVKLREQADGSCRPRFEPNQRVMAMGFRGQDLRHDDGRWFTRDEAYAFARDVHDKIKAARISGVRIKPVPVRKAPTVEQLMDDWLAALKKTVERGDMAATTLESYTKATRAVVYRPETREQAAKRREREQAAVLLGLEAPQRAKEPFAVTPVAAVGAPELRSFFDYARDVRGHHMAVSMVSAISAAFTWGRESPDWRLGVNPRIGMEFARPEGRIVIYTFEEFSAMVASADELGVPSIGDGYFLGLFTGQRQTDRLAMEDSGLIDGRRHLRQSKTGELVKIKDVPQLTQRLEAAKARVAAIKLKFGTRPNTIVVYEKTGLTYTGDTYRGVVADVRAHAAKRVPSLADKHDQDLRDTFVTMTYRAMVRVGRVDLKAIADISGHSHQSIETIIKHYLGRDEYAADQAMDILANFVGQAVAG